MLTEMLFLSTGNTVGFQLFSKFSRICFFLLASYFLLDIGKEDRVDNQTFASLEIF